MLSACNAFVDLDAIELADAGDEPTTCDPVAQLGCDGGLACVLRATDGLTPVCSAVGTTAIGATCAESLECEAGSQCIAWPPEYGVGRVCSRICERDSGAGCGASERCENPIGELLETFGFCVE